MNASSNEITRADFVRATAPERAEFYALRGKGRCGERQVDTCRLARSEASSTA
jgi:hypothetical protein